MTCDNLSLFKQRKALAMSSLITTVPMPVEMRSSI